MHWSLLLAKRRESVLQQAFYITARKRTCTSAYTHVLPFSLVFVTRAKYAFGLLGGNVQKPYFSVLKNGFGLLARSAYWPENTVIYGELTF